jgi:hypothetical protein
MKEVGYYPKAAQLSHGSPRVLDPSYAAFGKRPFPDVGRLCVIELIGLQPARAGVVTTEKIAGSSPVERTESLTITRRRSTTVRGGSLPGLEQKARLYRAGFDDCRTRIRTRTS